MPSMRALADEFGFTSAAVPAVSGEDQGQGRALQRLPEGQLPGAAGGHAEERGLKLDADAANAHDRSLAQRGRQLRACTRRPRNDLTGGLPWSARRCCRCRRVALKSRRVPHGNGQPLPVESLQHPLAVYDELCWRCRA